MKTCINCGHEVDTPFCSNCGQKQEVKRVSFRGMFEEFLSKWIGFDNQFGRTVIDMLKKPGKVVHSYLNGNRVKYIGPLGYAVIMTALVIISFDVLGLNVQDFIEQNESKFQETFQEQRNLPSEELNELYFKPLNSFMAKNYRFMMIAMLPFLAVSLGLFYRKRKLNYIERLVIATYTSCQTMWLTILSLIIFSITGYLASFPIFVASFIYSTYAMHKILPEKDSFESVVKAFFSIFCGFFFFILIFSIIIFGFMISIAIKNPQIFQQQG